MIVDQIRVVDRAGMQSTTAAAGPPPGARLRTLDAVFAAVARRDPRAVAVHEGTRYLTYGRAEADATRLASALVRAGVQLGDPVIVHCADVRQSLVAQLAVFKAGGVCVPVPREVSGPALRRVVAISAARSVLCSVATRAVWESAGLMVTLDDPAVWSKVAAVPVDRSLPRSAPSDAAYLIVDGGPCGRLVDHRAWGLAVQARVARAGVAGQVLTGYDGRWPWALTALWWAFAAGGTVRIGRCEEPLTRSAAWTAADAVVLRPEDYGRLLRSLPGKRRVAPEPRRIVLVGAPCPRELAELHFTVLPGTRLWAEFVPPGGVLPWTAREFSVCDELELSPAPGVGSPPPQVHVRILDGTGTTLPPGRLGEVCASGPALPFDSVHAPGSEPVSADGGPLLRSGLTGQWRPDGTLEITTGEAEAS